MEKNKGKDFLTRHIEKMALGLFAVVALFLLYQGFKLPDYTEKQQPQTLAEEAIRVKNSIDQPHWEALKEERIVKTEFEKRVDLAQQEIDTSHYATDTGWEHKPKQGGALRQDPELLAPGKPHMVGVLGAIAVQHPRERTYPLADLEEADPIEANVRTRRPSSRRNRAAAAMSPYGQGAAASPYGGGEGVGGPPSGYGEAGAGGNPYGESPYPGGTGAAGASGTAASSGPKVPKEYNEGFDASQLTPATEVARVTPETAHFIAGTALVPHKKLVDAYRLAFENSQGINADRDRPTYWEFEVERADVTDVPVDQLTDAEWKKVITFAEFEKQFSRWAGTAADVTPAEFTDPYLTLPLPPLMLHDNLRFAMHPALRLPEPGPRGRVGGYGTVAQRPSRPAGENGDEQETEGEAPAEGEATAAPQQPAARPRIGGGRPSFGAGPRGGAAGGSGAGYGGGSPYGGGESPYGGGASPYGGGESPYGGGGASPYGGGGASPYGGGGASPFGGSPFGGGLAGAQPEHKLVRFYDFADAKNPNSPKPGRKYVYRVHIAVEDPNFPQNPILQPPMRTLSPEVYARVSKKELASKDDPTKRDPRLWSDWSEPSEPISLPELTRIYVGPVEPADTAVARRAGQQGAQPVEYQRNPPQAEVVALQWDKALATNLIVPLETRPGSVLAKTAEARVIDPMDLTVRKTEPRRVDAQGIILDAFGGDDLELADDEEITAPGILLMFDTQGKLQVLDEIDHMQAYRLYSFADEREAAEAAAERANGATESEGGYPGSSGGASPAAAGGGGYPGGGGGGVYPGAGGRGAAPGGNRRGGR